MDFFLSLVSSRWDNDKVCLLDRAGSSLCTDVPTPSEKKSGKDSGRPSGSEFTILPNFASHVTPTKIAKRSVT